MITAGQLRGASGLTALDPSVSAQIVRCMVAKQCVVFAAVESLAKVRELERFWIELIDATGIASLKASERYEAQGTIVPTRGVLAWLGVKRLGGLQPANKENVVMR